MASFTIPLTFTVFLLICALQNEEQQESQQRGQATRLAEIEGLLNTLAAKTQVCTGASLC